MRNELARLGEIQPSQTLKIIHKIKTTEINTDTECGYVMKHLHKIKPTFISIFIRISKHLEVVKKLGLRPHFSTNFSGFGNPDETFFLVFDLLHHNFYTKRKNSAQKFSGPVTNYKVPS